MPSSENSKDLGPLSEEQKGRLIQEALRQVQQNQEQAPKRSPQTQDEETLLRLD